MQWYFRQLVSKHHILPLLHVPLLGHRILSRTRRTTYRCRGGRVQSTTVLVSIFAPTSTID